MIAVSSMYSKTIIFLNEIPTDQNFDDFLVLDLIYLRGSRQEEVWHSLLAPIQLEILKVVTECLGFSDATDRPFTSSFCTLRMEAENSVVSGVLDFGICLIIADDNPTPSILTKRQTCFFDKVKFRN